MGTKSFVTSSVATEIPIVGGMVLHGYYDWLVIHSVDTVRVMVVGVVLRRC